MQPIEGIHQVTAKASDLLASLGFHNDLLGQRPIKPIVEVAGHA